MADSVLLLAALVLAPVIGGDYSELANGILQILVLGGLIARLVHRSKNAAWARVPGFAPLAVFLLTVCLSAFFSESIYASLRQVIYLAACLGAYLLAATVCRDGKVAAAAVWAIVLPALGVCLVGVRHYAIAAGGGVHFWSSLLSSGTHDRLFGTFVNPGFFAGYLALVLPITMGAYLVTRKMVLALIAGIAVVLETAALMLTGTKFGIVAAVVALLVLFLLAIATGSLRRARFRRLIVIAVVLTPLLAVFSGPVTSRIGEAESGGSQVHSTTFRVYTWQATLNMIRDHPWLGVGPGTFDTAYPRYTIAGPTKNAHQSYLQIAAESGGLALAAFVLALISVAYWSLDGTVRGMREAGSGGQAASDETFTSSPDITWKDLVPFSGWRMVNCAIFAALAGSAVRNLADSDWFLAGIALPFAVAMGVLVAQSGAVSKEVSPRRAVRIGLAAFCGLAAVIAASFALGDLLAPDDFDQGKSPQQLLKSYRRASAVSPLNPKYRREVARYTAAMGDFDAAARDSDRAIRLAPHDAAGYQVRALIARVAGDYYAAIRFYEESLRYNPNSTQTLYQLALARQAVGDEAGYEAALRQLLTIEESDYEQIKGVPEMVDTTYAYAHAHFGEKFLSQKRYTRATIEFSSAVERLEAWRSNKQGLEVARLTGRLTPDEESELLDLLHSCYLGLADTYTAMGEPRNARRARENAEKVLEH